MTQTSASRGQLSAGAYFLGGLAFIPLLGVVPGLVCIVWGLVSRKAGGRTLALLGAGGVAFSVALYGGLYSYLYSGFVQRGGIYDDLRGKLAQTGLDGLVPQIEMYNIQNGHYPESLDALKGSLSKNNMVVIYDPTDVSAKKPREFYYERVGESHYYLRSVGPDGAPFTQDDLLPEVAGAQSGKLGLLLQRQPSP